MGKAFEIVAEGEFPGTPEQVWDAVTSNTGAWLFPSEGLPGVDLVSERPTHHVNRMEGPDGWFNQLEQVIEERPNGSYLRWVHSGVFQDDWDAQYDGASLHTAFYLHTLAEYLEHFAGRQAVFVDVQGPEASKAADAFEVTRAALGIDAATTAGTPTTVDLPGLASGDAVVDLQDEHFIGLRSENALFRFFGRNAFGGPVGLTVHHFGTGDAAPDAAALQRDWQTWLDARFV